MGDQTDKIPILFTCLNHSYAFSFPCSHGISYFLQASSCPKRRYIRQNIFCVCLRLVPAETNLLTNTIFEQNFNKVRTKNKI